MINLYDNWTLKHLYVKKCKVYIIIMNKLAGKNLICCVTLEKRLAKCFSGIKDRLGSFKYLY